MNILGICWNHDSHAAIISNGEIIASVGEERLSRIKNHYGFPYKSIEKCLEIANLKSNNIDLIAISNTIPASSYLNDIWFNSNTQYDVSNNFPLKLKLKLIAMAIALTLSNSNGNSNDPQQQDQRDT